AAARKQYRECEQRNAQNLLHSSSDARDTNGSLSTTCSLGTSGNRRLHVLQARKGEEELAGQPDWLRSEGPRAASQARCDSRLLEYNVARTLTVLAETQGFE